MVKKIILVLSVLITGVGIFMAMLGHETIRTLNNDLLLLDVFDQEAFARGTSGVIRIDPYSLEPMDEDLCIFWAENTEDPDEGAAIPLTGFDLDHYSASNFSIQDDTGCYRLFVNVSDLPEDERVQIIRMLQEEFASQADLLREYDADPEIIEYYEQLASEEGFSELDSYVSHVRCEVTSNNYPLIEFIGKILTFTGAVVLVITLLSYKFRPKQILLITLSALLLCIIIVFIVLSRKIATMSSLKKYTDGVYSVRYTADYKLDEILTADLSNESEVLSWASENLYYGLPLTSSSEVFGCSALYVTTPEGSHLMGRNYDFKETDCIMIYCDPKDGYASIGMIDPQYINIGSSDGQISPTDLTGRLCSIVFPYITVDGMNEAGLGISILMLDEDEIHQDSGNPDILMTVAIRAILDRCASVDEAVSFLRGYDMHSMLDSSFHLYITDTSGRAVVVEWLDGQMVLTDTPAVTNYVLGDPDFYAEHPEWGTDGRYEVLMEDIASCSGTATPEQAMSFLADASDEEGPHKLGTEWSCVYDLDNFEVTVCFDINYDVSYDITPSTFGVRR